MNLNFSDTQGGRYLDLCRSLVEGRGLSVHIITFGCQQNEADSERMLALALRIGYTYTPDPDKADLVIVNTCAIREHAEVKALSMLGRFKQKRHDDPDFLLGVVGCVAAEPSVADKLKKDFHYVSFTLEPNMTHRLPEVIYQALYNRKRSFIIGEDKGDIIEGIKPYRTNDRKAWVSVMYGCNNFCSYCIVPYVRGRERSRASQEIINECRELVASGYRDITLLGQNVNSYSSDMDFATLLECIAKIDGDFRIKFMTSHPKDVSEELIRVMGRYRNKISPYFHLPLQSGSNRILELMRRRYDTDRFLSIVDRLRSEIPYICISTDVIVGFPTETEEDFLETLEVLKRVEFDSVFAFKYSPREGTLAAKMEDQVPASVKDERIAAVLSLQESIALSKNESYVGREETVFVDSVSKRPGMNNYSARTDTNKLVHFCSDKANLGDFVRVKIIKANAYDLYAEEI